MVMINDPSSEVPHKANGKPFTVCMLEMAAENLHHTSFTRNFDFMALFREVHNLFKKVWNSNSIFPQQK